LPKTGGARLDPRVSVSVRVDIEYPARSGSWARAESFDLSVSGVYIRCSATLPLKAQVGCRLFMPPAAGEPDRLIDAQAVVVRVNPPDDGSRDWRYGLYFVEVENDDLEAIRRFVFASL
jgi:c-di-GMP-binding flagellar brake protein YcgR